jgi:hypothetical protein
MKDLFWKVVSMLFLLVLTVGIGFFAVTNRYYVVSSRYTILDRWTGKLYTFQEFRDKKYLNYVKKIRKKD